MNNCLICAHFSQCFVIEIRNSIRFRAIVVKSYQTSMSNLFHYFPDSEGELDSEPPPELPPIPGPPENIWNSSVEWILLNKILFFLRKCWIFSHFCSYIKTSPNLVNCLNLPLHLRAYLLVDLVVLFVLADSLGPHSQKPKKKYSKRIPFNLAHLQFECFQFNKSTLSIYH